MADREFVHVVTLLWINAQVKNGFKKLSRFSRCGPFWGFFQVFPCVHAACIIMPCLSTSRVVGHDDDEKTNDASRVSVCVEPGW